MGGCDALDARATLLLDNIAKTTRAFPNPSIVICFSIAWMFSRIPKINRSDELFLPISILFYLATSDFGIATCILEEKERAICNPDYSSRFVVVRVISLAPRTASFTWADLPGHTEAISVRALDDSSSSCSVSHAQHKARLGRNAPREPDVTRLVGR
jgi:hypothetical protein